MRLNLYSVHWSIAGRAGAAVLGGYALASAATACLTLALPFSRIDATLTAMMLSYLLYVLAVLWSFGARTARLAWLGLLLPTAVLAGAAWALHAAQAGAP